jgi:hypothetical protein
MATLRNSANRVAAGSLLTATVADLSDSKNLLNVCGN